MTPEKAKATYGYRAAHPAGVKALPRRLRGVEREAAEALREALEAATHNTSGLAAVALTPYETEAALRNLKRAGWQIVKDPT